MSLIDATPVKSHLVALLDVGMTYAEIAEAAGVTDSMVRYLRDRRTVQSAKAARILAVPVPVRGPIDPARADRASRIVKSDGHRHSESVRILTTEERLGDWRDQAACRGVNTETFFPRTTDPQAASHALAFCARCPVVEACRTFGLNTRQEYGVWGGTTPEDRAQSREMAS